MINEKLSKAIIKEVKNDEWHNLNELILNLENVNDKLKFRLDMPEFVIENPTILHMCCYFGSSDCFQYLLNIADLEITDSYGRNILHYASCSKKIEFIRILENNIDQYFYPDKNGLTPAHYAAIFGDIDLIKYFFLKGLPISNIEDNKKRSPIHLACMYDRIEVVEYYINNIKLEEIQTLLRYAIERRQCKILKCLLENGININEKIDGMTPLCYAAKTGNISILRFLWENGARDQLNETNKSPLIEACLNGNADMVRFFLQQGCDPNRCDERNISPLLAAVIGKNFNAVQFLIQSGAIIQPNAPKKRVYRISKCSKIELYEMEIETNEFTDENFKILKVLCENDDIKIFNLIFNETVKNQLIEDDKNLERDKEKILKQIFVALEKEGPRYTDSLYWGPKLQLKSSCDMFGSSKDKEENKEEGGGEEESSDENEAESDILSGLSIRFIFQTVVEKGKFTFSPKIEDYQILKPHYGRRYILMLTAIRNNSITIFINLIQYKLYPSDSTELYIECFQLKKYEFVRIMINDNLYYDKEDKTLRELASEAKNIIYIPIQYLESDSSHEPFGDAQFEKRDK